jgi:hypothetical protein
MLSKYEGGNTVHCKRAQLTRSATIACFCLRKMVRASMPGYCPCFLTLPFLKRNKESSSGNWLWNMQYKVQVCEGCEVCGGEWRGRSAAFAQKSFAMPVTKFTCVRMYKTFYCLQNNTANGKKSDKYVLPIALLVLTFLILSKFFWPTNAQFINHIKCYNSESHSTQHWIHRQPEPRHWKSFNTAF